MKIFAAFPSKYLKAADLHDKHVKTHMSHVLQEEMETRDGRELKPILYFRETPKGMVLNVTNAKAIAALYGDETEAWAGMPIILFPAMVAFGAETVEAIRVKAPSGASRGRAIQDSPHKDVLAERMHEYDDERLNRESQAKAPAALTPENLERARQAFLTRKPTPRPKPINDVVWDHDGERGVSVGTHP